MTVVRRRTACGGGFAALAAGGIAAFLFQQCSFLWTVRSLWKYAPDSCEIWH